MENLIELTKDTVKDFLPKRTENSHKGTYGRVLNIAGSFNYTGAAYLSSVSALKVGAGLVTLAAPESIIPTLASLSADVTYYDLEETEFGTICKDALKYLPEIEHYQTVSIGCGISRDGSTAQFVHALFKDMKKCRVPFVVDADAINAVSTGFFKTVPPNSVITPHPVELSRLLKISVEQIQRDRISYALMASEKMSCITLLKGFETIIATPSGKVYINKSGNSALAKAGMGDVLTGMIAGFSAQGTDLEEAVCLSAYLHGLCGELASKDMTEYGVLASMLINYIPRAIQTLL